MTTAVDNLVRTGGADQLYVNDPDGASVQLSEDGFSYRITAKEKRSVQSISHR